MVKKEISFNAEDDAYLFECPHCDLLIQVPKKRVNCQIFRHGVMKGSFSQINPHSSKQKSESLISRDLIYGCGKPFKMYRDGNDWSYVSECDYL